MIFKKLIILIIINEICKCQLNNQIYSQFYVNRYDFSESEGQAFNIKVATQSNTLFVASNQGGVIIFEAQTSKKIVQKTLGPKTLCLTVECSNDGSYFIAGVLPNLIQGFSFSQQTLQITKLYEYQFDDQIQDMIKTIDEKYLFVIGMYSSIAVVDFQVRNSFKIIASIRENNNRNFRQNILVSKSNQFFYVGGGMSGLFVYQYNQQQQQILNLANIKIGYIASACIGTSDNNYMYGTNQYTGLYVADLRVLQGIDPSQYPLNLPINNVWPFEDIQSLAYTINISQNEDLLYVGVRSQGILVFNITDKLNPRYFYQIQIISLSNYIAFSSNYEYLYYANSDSIYTFQLIEMSLNEQIPNIFNSKQFVQKKESSFNKPFCYILDDNFFFGFFNAKEVLVGQISGNPYQLDFLSSKVYNFWSSSLTQYVGSTILYIPLIGLSQTNIAFYAYDYSTLYTTQTMTLKLTFTLPVSYVNENITYLNFNLDQTLCVVAQYSGFYLLKFDGPLNITFLSYYKNQYYQIKGCVKRAIFSKDNKYILISIQNFGISVIQIQDSYKLVQVNDLQTLGAENMIKSEISTDYCFLLDGSKGFAIIDLTVLPQIKILSRITLKGWAMFGISLYNDNYFFVQQNEKGMISVIDMRDKKNISLFSTYERGADQAQSACVSKNGDFSFVENNKYVLVMPLKSQIMLQSTAQEIQLINNSYQFVKALKNDEILQVGQTVQFYFQILYPKSQKMVIQKINIYQNFQEQDLPTWMIYNQQTQTLTMEIDKTNAGTTKQQINRILLLVQTNSQLSSTSFYYPSGLGSTTLDQSNQIYTQLKSQSIIDGEDQLSSNFNPSLDLIVNISGIGTQIINNIKQTLVQSVWINQVVIQTQSSLDFDPSKNIISSRGKNISVQLYAKSGQYVTINYPGAIVQYSINQNQLDLQGPLEQINIILQGKIIFFSADSNNLDLIILTITDSINYPISYQCQASQCSFIKFKEQIVVQQQNSLQMQIESKYSDCILDIETSYSIQFIQSTFVVNDVQQITYSFYYKRSGMNDFVKFDPTFWLQAQSDKQLQFYGNTQYSQLGYIYTIKIVASDGYTNISDQFILKISGIPLSFVINILLKVIGPLVAVLGLYRYRSLLINSIIAKQHNFSQENVIVEAKYYKKIPLIGNQWKRCSILIDELFVILLKEVLSKNQKSQVKRELKQKPKLYQVQTDLAKNKSIFKQIEGSDKSSLLEQRYLTESGDVKMHQVLQDITKYQEALLKKNKQLKLIKEQFNQQLHPGSLYFESLKSYVSQKFLKYDAKSYFIFQFIKQQLIDETNTKNDWYLKVMEIDHNDQEEFCHSPFSKIEIKQKELQRVISIIYDSELVQFQTKSIISNNTINSINTINMRLIEDCLISEAQGLVFDKLRYFQQYKGESIHLNSEQISNIQAFKLCEKGLLQKIRKICNQEYIPYGVQQNMKFPHWLNMRLKDCFLKFYGTPTSQVNEEQILIKIFDLNGYVVKQFIVNIQPYVSNTLINIPQEEEQGDQYDFAENEGQAFNIKVATQSNTLFVASNQGGVIIFEAQTSKKIVQKTLGPKTLCLTVECSNDGSYFIAGVLPNLIQGFSFSQQTLQITKLYEYQFDDQIQDMIKTVDEKYLFVIGMYSSIAVVDFQVRNSFKIIASIRENNNRNFRQNILVSKSNQFFYVGGGMSGIFVYKYNEQQQQILNLANAKIGYIASACIGTSDNNYMYGTNQYTGLYVADLRVLQGIDPSQYPLNLPINNIWPFEDIQSLAFTIKMSQNEDLLYVGVRSQGILVFNITDKLNPRYFYQIQIISLSNYIAFSSNYQYLYYANSDSIYTFQLIEMSLNEQIPNIFNSKQFVQKKDSSFNKRFCYILDDNFFFAFFNSKEVLVGQISGNPYQLDFLSSKAYKIQSASLIQYVGSTILYIALIGLSQTNIAFYAYDYSTLYTTQTMTLKLTFTLPDSYVNENITFLNFNLDQTLCAVAQFSGFYLLKFDGPLNITFLSQYKNQYYQIKGTTKRAIFSKDNTYILISIQNFGISVIQIQDSYKLVQVNDLQTLGAENMIKSEISTDYCFLLDGSKGFAIIDLTVLPQIKILSRITLKGWAMFGISLYNDNYFFVQQNEKGMVSVIDMRDKKNISLFSTYERGADQAQSACVSKNGDFSFVENNKYVLVMPLKSQIMLQSTAQEIQLINNSYQFVKALKNDEILQVGQTVQFYFQILYPKSQKMVIQKINIYQNFQEQDLPTWMIYNQQTQTLTMQIDKTNAGTTKQQINRILLLVQTNCQLSSSSFYYPNGLGSTTLDQSNQIYTQLKSQSIIDGEDQLSSNFNPSLDLILNIAGIGTQIINNIKQTLVQSVWINQVVIQTQSSIDFDPSKNTISSRGKSISVQLYAKSGQYVTINYPGAIVQYSINQNQLDLQGPLEQINIILQGKIIFFSADSNNLDLIILTITDSINYPISYQCQASQCSFIKFKEQIAVQQQNNLQMQIESKHSDCILDIETSYSIQFLQSTFVVNDVQQITYSFYYKRSGMNDFVKFDPTFWLQAQSDKQLQFYGNTQYSQLGYIYTIKIVASDGYTNISDQFILKISGIPLSFVVNILLKVIGPLIAVLGLYRYRSLLINSIIAKQHNFSQENVVVESKYYKKIPLIGNQWKRCSILIDELFVILLKEVLSKNQKSQAKRELKQKPKLYQVQTDLAKNKSLFKQIEGSDKSSLLEQRYLTESGDVKMHQVLQDITKYQEALFKKNKQLKLIKEQFNQQLHPGSLYYESLKSYVSQKFLKYDAKSYFIFQFIKQQLIDETNTKNDWYLKVMEIDHNDQEEFCHSPFSKIEIKQKELQRVISTIYDSELVQFQTKSIISNNTINSINTINMRLIEDCLISEAQGLVFDKLRYFQQYKGESIHLNSEQISNIQAFKLCEKGLLQKIRKICNQEYIPYGVQQNMKFPHWLNMRLKDCFLKFYGTPTSQVNEEQILIKIFDLNGYLVKQFIVNIQPYVSNTLINIPQEEEQGDQQLKYQLSLSNQFLFFQQKSKLVCDSKIVHKVSSRIDTPKIISQNIQSLDE
ncbi:hypothetical protein ABPG74_007230 [Tetrahymena malaccensis]